MGAVLILTFLVLIAPLSYLYGVDSPSAPARGGGAPAGLTPGRGGAARAAPPRRAPARDQTS